ncbi:MAG: metal-dependent transcriptional regulator [Acidimicrobiia bacterium]
MVERRPSIAREDYLQTIRQLEEEGAPIIRARLADRLHVSAPSVSEATRSLIDDGLVEVADNRELRLTPPGVKLADNVVRRHRVAERILTDLVKLPWHIAHEEAHKLEHGLSDRVVDAALEVLGYPTTCPHGSPIPGSGYQAPPTVTIAEVEAGTEFVLEQVGEGIEVQSDLLAYMEDKGFTPGCKGTVTAVAPDGTVSIDVSGTAIAIGSAATTQMFVTVR